MTETCWSRETPIDRNTQASVLPMNNGGAVIDPEANASSRLRK